MADTTLCFGVWWRHGSALHEDFQSFTILRASLLQYCQRTQCSFFGLCKFLITSYFSNCLKNELLFRAERRASPCVHVPKVSQKDSHYRSLLTWLRGKGGWDCFFNLASILKYLIQTSARGLLGLQARRGCRPAGWLGSGDWMIWG